MTQIHDVIGMYIGQQCETPDGVGTVNIVTRGHVWVYFETLSKGKYKPYDHSQIKLHLRKIESLSEEEAKADDGLYDFWGHVQNGRYPSLNVRKMFTPSQFLYLLKLGIDLFGLIESGEAKEKDKMLKPNEYICSECGNVYEFAWTEEEAKSEARKTFGEQVAQHGAVVCDDCYKKIMSAHTQDKN